MDKKPLIGVSIIAVVLLVLGSFSFFITCVSADGLQITIKGGIGYHASVYNPSNESFTATLDVTNLITHKLIEHAWWTVLARTNTTYFRVMHGFMFISAHVVALDKTATRNGIAIGPFVIFGAYK